MALMINISSISAAFKEYGTNANTILLNRLAPKQHSRDSLLGDFASQLMLEELQGQGDRPYKESINEFVHKNIVRVLACENLDESFHRDAQNQKKNIRYAVRKQLPEMYSGFKAEEVQAEVPFVCEELGLQGRIDFLLPANEEREKPLILEQKSGKAAFVPGDNHLVIPTAVHAHLAQTLLYNEVLNRLKISEEVDSALVYSKYQYPVLEVEHDHPILEQVLRLKDELIAAEEEWAEHGFEFLTTLTADDLNATGTDGKLWNQYTKPYIESVLEPIREAGDEERAYFLEMLQFVQREMVASESPSQFVPLFRAVYSFITAPQDRKELIIGKRQPRVDENATLTGDYGEFNELQLKIKQAQELFVLVGPPGTGKTSYGMLYTVQEALTEEGSEVAIMAYTNRAVDEICEKLQEHGIAFTRIGQEENCAPAHKPYMLDNQVMKISKLLEIKEFIQGQRVIVGTTTAFNSHPQWFKLKNFTHCIIDEAAQLIDPQILNVLVSSRSKVILIGDHKQLPAVTREKAPNSLFIRTLESDCKYTLTRQGRMHEDILRLANALFYNNMLSCVPLPHQIEQSTKPRVTFTDIKPRKVLSINNMNANEAEAEAVIERLKTIPEGWSVGVITPYRAQIKEIEKRIKFEQSYKTSPIIIDTVERFQGSQCDVIIYCFTVQYESQMDFITMNNFMENGALIDPKLNVAITRAKRELHIIGNRELLESNPLFYRLINQI